MSTIRTVLVASTLILSAGTANASADAPQWTVNDSNGQVTALISGEARILPKGSVVPVGAAFMTGRDGTVVLERGEETVVLSPNSRLRVADPAPSRGLVQILADQGTATFHGKSSATSWFAISTPYLSAATTSAHFSVSVSTTGASVKALGGSVQVFTNDGRSAHVVTAGKADVASIEKGDRLKVTDNTQRIVDLTTPASTVQSKPAA